MISKNFTTAFETSHLCDVCSEAVSNPLCPYCLAEEIDAWLTLYPDLRKILIPQLKKYLANISNRITSYGTTCIKCGEKRAFVCPYCFTEFVFNELEKINAGNRVVQEFLDFFNFDFEHKGYFKEAEEEGMTT
ncbi:MAG: hypothetical protein RL557_169 [archaeon]|jgi:hypothetical protein